MLLVVLLIACSTDEPPPTEADELGVGAQCAGDNDCSLEDADTDGAQDQECLTQFKGGYCGLSGCSADIDCPDGSACVAHTDGVNYCFRICANKPECNHNRDVDNESNCSSNITFVDGGGGKAACRRPGEPLRVPRREM